MLALKIIGIILLVIFLFCMIPIGADIGYENNQLSLSAKICGLYLQLLPKGEKAEKVPKEKKPKKEKKKKKEPEEQKEKPKKKLNLELNFDEIIALLKKVFKGLGKFTRFKVDRFLLHYVGGGDDPYKTAVTFGKINAAICALAPVCRERFQCPDTDVFTDVDYTAGKTAIDFGLGFSIRIGQIFGAVNTILFGALGILIKNKIRILKEKIILKMKKKSNKNLESYQENISEEERISEENGK